MNIEQFLTSEYSFAGSTILFFAVIVGGLVLALTMYTINLRNKMTVAAKPTYGFLGKPLYQMAAFAFILGGMALSVYTITSPGSGISNTSARQDLDVEFTYKILQKGSNYQIEFDFVPLLNKKKWGGDVKNKFDIFVNIKGKTQYNQFSYDRTSDTGGKFTKIIAPDNYEVVISIITDNATGQFTKTLNLGE